MEKIDMLILTKHMYTMDGDGVGYREDCGVAVDRGVIRAVGPNAELRKQFQAERTIEAADKVLMPGFIDGHMHTGHGVLRGVAQDINSWMMDGMAPFEAQRSSGAKDSGSRLAIAEAIMNGTTTIGDDGLDMEGACRFIEQTGVRGNVSVRVREALPRAYGEGELYEFDEGFGRRTLNDSLRIFEQFDGADGGRIRIRFGPQGPDFVSAELLNEVKKLAKERKTKIHMHLEQGSREAKQMQLRYGMRGIPWLEQMGYLDGDFVGIHLTDATKEDVEIMAGRGAGMVLCSASIGIIDGIVPPAHLYQQAGGTVGLGSDQAPGNNCHNIINEMKMTAILNKVRYEDPEVMPAWKVVRMATIENARVLGLADTVGSIAEGKDADLILIDLKQASLMPLYTRPMRNFIPNLVYSARGNEVDTVIVKGRILMEQRQPKTFDLSQILADVQEHADEIGRAAEPQFLEINGKNAQYMREGKL